MFKCCVCGKMYNSEVEAIKCINKCARTAHENGQFVTKEAKHSEQTTVNFKNESDCSASVAAQALIGLMDKGIAIGAISSLYRKVFNNWRNINDNERKTRLNYISSICEIYKVII